MTRLKVLQMNTTYHSYNSTIEMSPIEVKTKKKQTVRLSKYPSRPYSENLKKHFNFKFKLGNEVRLTYLKNIFSSEHDET